MRLVKWEKIPFEMQNSHVKKYYDKLQRKKVSLFFKRMFDVFGSLVLLILFAPLLLVIAICVKIDSKGPVFYRQVRVTQYKKTFRIFKFRTMVQNADKIGTAVTVNNDSRITKVGKLLRKLRLDEIPQLINVLTGDMTFVGTRPEVQKYVEQYSEDMMATLLLPAGIVSKTSVLYKDESVLLDASENPDKTYVEEILPAKMFYNLRSLSEIGIFQDIKVLFMTVFAMLGKDYKDSAYEQKKVENTTDESFVEQKMVGIGEEHE